MSRRSTRIRAAIAGGAGLATVVGALVGLGPFAAAQGQAATVQSIVPTSAATDSSDASSGKGYCQTYKITALDDTGSTMNAGNVDVIARPDANSTLDVDFCSTMDQGNGAAVAPLNPTNNGPGDFDEATFPIVNGTATVGVQAVAGSGHATVKATIGTSSKSADLQVLVAPKAGGGTTDTTSQNDVVNTLAASPPSVSDTPGSTEHFTVTATCVTNPALSDQIPCPVADATVGGATISYAVTDAQHNVVQQSGGHPNGSCGTTSDADGTIDCAVPAPTPTTGSTGPYTVTFYDHQARCTGNTGTAPQPTCEPTATATLNSFPAPAANSAQIKVSCGGASTERTASNQCAEPTSATSETFTASVTSTSSGNAALSTVVVTWSLACTSSSQSVAGVSNTNPNATGTNSGNNNCTSVDSDTATYNSGSGTSNGTAKLSPTSCVTGSNGTCTTTLTLSAPAPEGLAFDVTGTIKDYTSSTTSQESDTASVIFTNKFSAAPTNIAVSAASSTPTTGTTDQITATVTNAFGNAAGSGTSVTFTLTGQGTFTNGAVQQTVTTGPDGKARVAIQSSTIGSTTVKADLDPKQTNCSASGGQCSASTTVVWAGSPSPSPSPSPGSANSLPAYRSGSHNYFRNSLNGGSPTSTIAFGNPGDVPLWGDWNGDGTPTIGVYRPSNRTFYLSNDNKTAAITVTIGNVGDRPASGDFNGDGTDSIALFRPSSGTWFITNNDHSVASHFVYGTKGDRPIVGDWTGQGVSKVGVYRPGTATFYRIGHSGIRFGNVGDHPIVGDWNGDGTTTIGIVRGTKWYVSNNNSTASTSFTYGVSGAQAFTWSHKVSPAAPTS